MNLRLAGLGLPQGWQDRDRFVVLETGFGLGSQFLATWDTWRQDLRACRQLHYLSIGGHPLTRDELRQGLAASPLPVLAQALIAAWPPLTPNLHRLSFERGRVQLLLAVGEVAAWLPELSAGVDAFDLDGFGSGRDPEMQQDRFFKGLARLANPGATLATGTTSPAMRAGLTTAGFDVRLVAGTDGQPDTTRARFAPLFKARRRPDARRAAGSTPSGRVLVVGAGLAGCAAAWALAEQGCQATLIDRHEQPAQEASGNPAGLFHGIVNRQDGAHARFNRAAALQVATVVQQAITEQGVPGSTGGLLRLDPGADIVTLRQQLAATGLPADYVQAVSAEQGSALCGMPLPHAGWFFPGGGWVAPGALAAALLARAGTVADFRGGHEVAAMRHGAGGWALLDGQGQVIDTAPTLVLANAFDALRLMSSLGALAWPVEKVRGQISLCPSMPCADCVPTELKLPITGAGYLLPVVNGQVAFGATSQAGDNDPSVRRSDHVHNLAQLARLTGASLAIEPETLQGRTAWRMVSSDRLPIIGAVPDEAALAVPGARRPDQPRLVPRLPGLFVFTALGSRGITWSALGAQVLASSITGAPQPLEASLLDAIDPARFIARAARRSNAGA